MLSSFKRTYKKNKHFIIGIIVSKIFIVSAIWYGINSLTIYGGAMSNIGRSRPDMTMMKVLTLGRYLLFCSCVPFLFIWLTHRLE